MGFGNTRRYHFPKVFPRYMVHMRGPRVVAWRHHAPVGKHEAGAEPEYALQERKKSDQRRIDGVKYVKALGHQIRKQAQGIGDAVVLVARILSARPEQVERDEARSF